MWLQISVIALERFIETFVMQISFTIYQQPHRHLRLLLRRPPPGQIYRHSSNPKAIPNKYRQILLTPRVTVVALSMRCRPCGCHFRGVRVLITQKIRVSNDSTDSFLGTRLKTFTYFWHIKSWRCPYFYRSCFARVARQL